MTGKKLLGTVLQIEKTGERRVDNEGQNWEKCIFTLKITGLSKRTPQEKTSSTIIGKEVKQVRWCCYNWHYKSGVKTLDSNETEAVLNGKPIDTVYW
jgi:hypothetical protein